MRQINYNAEGGLCTRPYVDSKIFPLDYHSTVDGNWMLCQVSLQGKKPMTQ